LAGGAFIFGLELLWRELILFASVGFLIGGLDELAIDLIWLARATWRSLFIYTRHARTSAETLAPPKRPGLIVIFVAAWDESDVIGAMLRNALATLEHPHYRIYLGCYPNDATTIAAAKAIDHPNLRIVIGRNPGPTTKADCLNTLWRALLEDQRRDGVDAKAIVLHDAEDVVHPQELQVFDTLIERFALVQLPVFPLLNPHSRWIAGHYCDEFAEAHGKALVVREALGAAIPAAGVGCAFAYDMLVEIAAEKKGQPFDAQSLTEDYELGLMVGALGGKTVLANLPSRQGRVQVNAHFPASLEAAVRQKARWIIGIALAGYDRLGWGGGFAETWMRLRDRRALVSAMLLCIGYLAILLTVLLAALHLIFRTALPTLTPFISLFVALNALLLLWRALVRAFFVTRLYGWREGLIAMPRLITANVIAIMASRRALFRYLKMRRTGIAEWEKTRHIFPTELPRR
jgi:adsorption protein B